jgi:HKD family nuclease
MITIIHNPAGNERFGQLMIANLTSKRWTSFRAAIAFVKRSGVKHIAPSLSQFAKRAAVKISVGIDHCGTSFEGVDDLRKAIGSRGELWVFHNESARHPTFHPKIYLFSNSKTAECFIGSGNLTEGGFFTNYEAFVHLRLNSGDANDKKLLAEIGAILDLWTVDGLGTALRVNPALLNDLKVRGDLPSESQINRLNATVREAIQKGVHKEKKKIFASVPVPPPPRAKVNRSEPTDREIESQKRLRSNGFVITLQKTDVGVGQITEGTARRSPELFLPKVCVTANPQFWGWPGLFKRDPDWNGKIDRDGFGKMDREAVRMRLGTSILEVNWWYNPNKIDFRMRNEALRSAGNIGDVLKIESGIKNDGYDYYVEIIPRGTPQFARFEALCTEQVRNSPKRYGYY